MQYCARDVTLNADTAVNSRDMLNGAGASNASAQKNMAGSCGSSSGVRPKERYGGKSVNAMTKKELQEILGKVGLTTTGLKAELREK